jgi:hemerythrin-like domain-containing protein
MGRSTDRAGLITEPIPENLFREPIDYLFADHYRQRLMLNALDDFLNHGYFRRKRDPVDREALAAIVQYLRRDFPLHVADEEEGLFPLLVARCRDDEGAVSVLRQLTREHADDHEEVQTLLGDLEQVLDDKRVADTWAFMRRAMHFVETQRRHLAWENNVVLPLARGQLTEPDLAELGQGMAVRRGAKLPS